MPLPDQIPEFAGSYPAHRPLARLAEIEIDLGDPRRDYEGVRPQSGGEKGACQILVDHGGDAFVPGTSPDYRDSAAARAYDDLALVHEGSNARELQYLEGLRRGHDPAPSPPRVLLHRPAAPGLQAGCDSGRVEGSHRLGGVAEAGVGRIHLDLGDEAGDRDVLAPLLEHVAQDLLQEVSEVSLRGCDIHVHPVRRHRGACHLVPDQLEADLRTVPVRDHDAAEEPRKGRDLFADLAGEVMRIQVAAPRGRVDHGVAADGYNDCPGGSFTHQPTAFPPFRPNRSRPSAPTTMAASATL